MTAPEDLTGRARVRDAALAEFAERGTAGASMRSVAARAGVSVGLVQHHFHTKQGLREGCDEYAVAHVRRGALDGVLGGRLDLATLMTEGTPVARYLARALGDGSPGAAALFDELVDVTEAYLAELPDAPTGEERRDRALVLTAMRLGALVLRGHLDRGLGVDATDGTAAARLGAATLAVLHPDLVPPDRRADVRTALTGIPEETS